MAYLIGNPNMDMLVASRVLEPAIRRAVENVQDGARRAAPPVSVWVSARDERVRHSHVQADGQSIPDNLRFQLEASDGGTDLARAPRDPDLPIGQRINCRCVVATLPRDLKDSIHADAIEHIGTRVRGEVYTRYPRAAESEFGNTTGDEPAGFMAAGLRDAAARMGEAAAR